MPSYTTISPHAEHRLQLRFRVTHPTEQGELNANVYPADLAQARYDHILHSSTLRARPEVTLSRLLRI